MTHFKSLLSRSVLALALATLSAAAFAGPTYHVAIDTATLGSGDGYLDLTLSGLVDSAPTTATLSHFAGTFGSYTEQYGMAGGSVADAITLINAGGGWNEFFQSLTLGGLFSFDVSFDTSGSGAGTTFGAALYDSDGITYLGTAGNLVQIDLLPGTADTITTPTALADVTAEVPEPSVLLSLVIGLGAMGGALRRRAR
jgi:hypothetical protein